ncbi:putative short-chain dehydrogenases/reductase [Coniella lustricola]|uniref:Putative short-chain dehydrogenases/reductase n=1 Tax=Coniella lustricola TaxID=2025994 RepID=A0A2T3A9C2_9PEZI|nr:putative short-chain dehydrogenases/reductase [Coniella lustricola]
MPELSVIQESNSRISARLPPGLVAVFVGATSGIGEYALKAFVRNTKSPRVYFIGRSRPAADKIVTDLKNLNPEGTYNFIQSDVALLKNVNTVSQQILAQEDKINLLFMTQGTMALEKTTEGLIKAYVLPVTSRILFALNLLPALQKATDLKRVVSVFTANHEGTYDANDWLGYPTKHPLKARGHMAVMVTLAHNVLAQRAPDVSFIHNFPGSVKTSFGKDATGSVAVLRHIFNFFGHFVVDFLPPETCGALQLYCATSARFPPASSNAVESGNDASGVPVSKGVAIAKGTDGKIGSGSYSVPVDCDDMSPEVEKVLVKAKAEGAEKSLWAHLMGEIKQHTGKVF